MDFCLWCKDRWSWDGIEKKTGKIGWIVIGSIVFSNKKKR